jgi:hypothetical protein
MICSVHTETCQRHSTQLRNKEELHINTFRQIRLINAPEQSAATSIEVLTQEHKQSQDFSSGISASSTAFELSLSLSITMVA